MGYLLAIVSVGASATIAVMAIRMAGLKADAAQADLIRKETERALGDLMIEWNEYRTNSEEERDELQRELRLLDDDLDKCRDPAVVRHRLRRLLS